jgi:hypothetical protein
MNTKTFLFLALSSFLFSCGGGEAVELKLKVSTGDVFESRVTVDQKVTTSAMGMTLDVDQVMNVYQTITVKAVDSEGNTTMESVTDRFVMKQNMPMMGTPINVEFDTDNPEKAGAIGESMAPYFQKMKGLTYQLVLDTRGTLISSDMQEVYKKLGMDSLSGQGGNKTPEGNSEQYMTILPDKPLKKGDKYVIELPSTGAGFTQKNTYTVKEITADLVTFEVAGEFNPAKADKPEGATVEVSGTQTGTVQIDRKTGMTVKSDLKQDLKMNITSMGMSMPTTSTGTTTFTCTKK